VPTIVARLFLPEMASRFLKLYPQITLEIVGEDTFIDVLAAGYDAGIRYDERLERDMIAVPIGPRRQRYVTAAAPRLSRPSRRAAASEGPDRSRLHPPPLSQRSALAWEFDRDGETFMITPTGPDRRQRNRDGGRRCALPGLGIIRTFEEFWQPAIRGRRAGATVLKEWATEFSGPFLYYASRRHMPAPLRAFVDFVKAEQRKTG
jgi:DNA-binding transcriptional LysR family regulator